MTQTDPAKWHLWENGKTKNTANPEDCQGSSKFCHKTHQTFGRTVWKTVVPLYLLIVIKLHC